MSSFSDIITQTNSTLTILPLFHACDTYALREIFKSMSLKVQRCDVFVSEDLIYCFYGKTSYRINLKQATRNPAYFPACFILDTNQLPHPHKIFPFDTGAFVKLEEIRKTYFHHNMKVEHFMIGNKIDDARSLIEKIYTTNLNYYNSIPTIDTSTISSINFEAISYINLIQSQQQANFDDRISSIEVIFNQDIPLSKQNVLNIVLPNIFLDNREFRDIIENELGISDPIGYDTYRANPLEYQSHIMYLVKTFMTNLSLL